MLRDRFLKKFFIMAIAIIAMAEFGIHELSHVNGGRFPGAPVPQPRITMARAKHILYGDAHGGGHLHGTGAPCKSEFPADWSEDKIIAEVLKEAANDNLDWRHEKNGNDVADATDEGVKIRIVVNARHTQIITAYPLNTPRNPCPAANDNGD